MATVDEKQTCDEIIAEMRKIKDLLAAAQGYDIQRILDDARDKQRQSEHPIIPPPPKH